MSLSSGTSISANFDDQDHEEAARTGSSVTTSIAEFLKSTECKKGFGAATAEKDAAAAIPPLQRPLDWSQNRKRLYSYMLNYLAFSGVFASSVYTPAIEDVSEAFHVSRTLAILPFSCYFLGMAFGPMIASPLSEHYGRKPVILIGLTVGCAFTLGAGFTSSISALIVCRFFAGAFFSPPLGICPAAMADIFTPVDRSVPLSVCAGVAFLGPAVAPLIGGYVVSTYDWRWTQWLALIFIAPCFLYFFMRESYLPVLEKRHRSRGGHEDDSVKDAADSGLSAARQTLLKTLVRPSVMLIREPIMTAFSLYIGFNFGLNYAFFTAYPYVFGTTYGLSLTGIGLTFTGLAVGVILGTVALVAVSKKIYIRKLVKVRETSGPSARLPPEERLYGALIGGPSIVVSLFMFAWTARSDISFYVPIVAEAFFGFGNVLVYSSVSQYLVDHYGAARGASATAAQTLVRYMCGFAFPVFTTQIYQGLGTGWAGSLLGFVSVLLACIPWLMFKFGARLRNSS